ncbi:MAG: twin-arginine translocase TatA/TatE family subunit [Bacteroidetes bacterium]|nr:twin-arginine translocase TatA/TatE family subunit [Bacteroidota bacterium]
MFGSFGGVELIVIVLIILLLFGAKKIPELARGIGQGINEFKKASSDIRKEIEKGQSEADEISKTNDTVKNKN